MFGLFQKLHPQIYASQFMTNYSTSICPFESRKCGKEGKNYKNLNIFGTRSTLLIKKAFFIVFEELSFVKKIKNWKKIADTSFKYKMGPSWIGNMQPAKLQKSACLTLLVLFRCQIEIQNLIADS